MRRNVGWILATGFSLMTVTIAGTSAPAVAQETEAGQAVLPTGPSFRVETEVFEGDSVEPAARHLVLFDAGVIYDFRLDSDRFATMFDPTRGRILLVDRRDKTQTSVATTDLLQATAQLRAAVEQEGKAERFGLNAVVTNDNDSATAKFKIEFADTKYSTTTQPVSVPQIARSYNHFATLASQLNVVQGLGAPPFARMTLGQQIADAGLLPLETNLEVRRGLQKERWRSHLLVVEQLSALDKNRISDFGNLLGQCKTVPFAEFGK